MRNNKNLQIVTKPLVKKLHFKEQHQNLYILWISSANKEIILGTGAVGTPHLLMLSGIGPRAHLEQHGIDIVVELPGVGQNPNEHPDFVLKYKYKKPVTLWPITKI